MYRPHGPIQELFMEMAEMFFEWLVNIVRIRKLLKSKVKINR